MTRVRRRGQPVFSLVVLLLAWIGARTWLLESAAVAEPDQQVALASQTRSLLPADATPAELAAHGLAAVPGMMPPQPPAAQPSGSARRALNAAPQALPGAPLAPIAEPRPRIDPIIAPPDPRYHNPRLAGGHQLLWLAALAQLPLPPEARIPARNAPDHTGQGTALALPLAAKAQTPRFSGDAWLLLRRGGSGSGALGSAPASYGASQAGAVIRYRLAPSSALRPTAYLRASGAVHSPHDEELAAGLSLRPAKRLPIAAMAELRVTRLGSAAALRPAVLLVSEFAPLPLPGGLRAEAYGAAGYVGGRFATPFAEGQLRLDRAMARIGRAELRAGGGAWGGAQQGASRLDIGPGATLDFPLGAGSGRLSADWRFRLAGRAAPQSGPALTISAGF